MESGNRSNFSSSSACSKEIERQAKEAKLEDEDYPIQGPDQAE